VPHPNGADFTTLGWGSSVLQPIPMRLTAELKHRAAAGIWRAVIQISPLVRGQEESAVLNQHTIERILAGSLAGQVEIVEYVLSPSFSDCDEFKNAARVIRATLIRGAVEVALIVKNQSSGWLAPRGKTILLARFPLSQFLGKRERGSAAENSSNGRYSEEMTVSVQGHTSARKSAMNKVEVNQRYQLPLTSGEWHQLKNRSATVRVEGIAGTDGIIAPGVGGPVEISGRIEREAGTRLGAFIVRIGEAVEHGFLPGAVRRGGKFVDGASPGLETSQMRDPAP